MDLPLRVVVVVSVDWIAGVVILAVGLTTELGTACAVSLPSLAVDGMSSSISSSSLTETFDVVLLLKSRIMCLSFTLTVLPLSLRTSNDLGSARFRTIVPRRDHELSVSYRIRTGVPGLIWSSSTDVSSVVLRGRRIDGIWDRV